MKLDYCKINTIKQSHIGTIDIIEKIEKITNEHGNTIRYSTLFYDHYVKVYEVELPMITNKCLDNIKTKSELKKLLNAKQIGGNDEEKEVI